MARLVVLYRKAADPAAFDNHYVTTHIPLAKAIPGLRRYEVSAGPVTTPGGPSPYELVALLDFDSVDAIGQGFATPQGQAAAADLKNFAQAGAELLMFETKPA